MVAFLLPYFFVFNPALLGYGTWSDILPPLATGVIGVYSLGFSSQGYFRRDLKMWERIGCGIFAIMLIMPEIVTDIIGVAGIVGFVIYFMKTSERNDAIA
jgi:TRAP-type uncharacterized transport system fused permease subunit